MSDGNRDEDCGRIGGRVYMRTDKPCPECGVIDTHTPSSVLRARVDAWRDTAIAYENAFFEINPREAERLGDVAAELFEISKGL